MKITLYILLAVTICSCKQNTKEPEVRTAPSQVTEVSEEVIADLNETNGSIVTTFQREEVGAIYEAYLDLKAALVNTNAREAATIAKDFRMMLKDASDNDQGAQSLMSSLDEMALATNVKQQRTVFEKVTEAVEKVIMGEITSGEVIKQYCPMAFNGKGAYWLSDSKEIRNPYYGDKMLKCGVVDSEIQ